MKIISLDRVTSGGLHAWYMTDLGFTIRKQIGDHVGKFIGPVSRETRSRGRVSLWSRFVAWIKSW